MPFGCATPAQLTELTLPWALTVPSYATFLNLMQFIYTDSVDVNADAAIELYVAADLYTMTRLKVGGGPFPRVNCRL